VTTKPSVLIADDHAPTREMVRRVVEENGFRVCAEAGDAHEAIRVARETAPDVAILDVRMPGNGLRACEVIRSERPEICIMMLTISENAADVLAALSAGASAYWLKGEDPELIPRIVRRVLRGELIIAGSLLKVVVMTWGVRDLRQRLRDYLPQGVSLSPKEYEVIELMSEGLTTAEIGRRLFVADVTVRTHIANIVHKLHVLDREDVRRMISKLSETKDLNANP
jgi:two-component system nitrate/nitrite response regulator NarL